MGLDTRLDHSDRAVPGICPHPALDTGRHPDLCRARHLDLNTCRRRGPYTNLLPARRRGRLLDQNRDLLRAQNKVPHQDRSNKARPVLSILGIVPKRYLARPLTL